MRARGMNVELILLNFYRRPFTDTCLLDTGATASGCATARPLRCVREHLSLDARQRVRDSSRRQVSPGPRRRRLGEGHARFVKANRPLPAPGHRPSGDLRERRGEIPYGTIRPPWRIGEFFGGDDAIDVLSQQTGAAAEGTRVGRGAAMLDRRLYDPRRQPGDRRFSDPVMNTENGYEFLPGQPTEKRQVHHTDKVRAQVRGASSAPAGTFAAGFNGTIGHSECWNRIDRAEPLRVHREGRRGRRPARPAARLLHRAPVLADAALRRRDGRCRRTRRPGKDLCDLSSAWRRGDRGSSATRGPLTAVWFNPRSGALDQPMRVTPANIARISRAGRQ